MAKTGLTPATRGTFSKTVSIPADEFGRPNTNPPDVVDIDNVTLYSFAVDTDKVTYKFGIPSDYHSGDIEFFTVWTNDGGTDDNGKEVEWQLDYQVSAEGDAVNGSHANSPKTCVCAYPSASGWIEVHSTDLIIAAADFAGKECIFLKLSAITPGGTPLTCNPHLIGMCYTYLAKWGRKP